MIYIEMPFLGIEFRYPETIEKHSISFRFRRRDHFCGRDAPGVSRIKIRV
jgi:hypothetical protein